MKVEIWSDVTCPHCYTAKRKFETALSKFKHRDKIEVSWRSFELAPGLKTDPDKLLPQFLQELHNISREQVQGMIDRVTNAAKEVGLEFHLDKAIPANSFNAHRLSHLAKANGLQEKMEERMLKAYFTEGKNMADIQTLAALAKEIGLDAQEVKSVLESNKYEQEVYQDLNEARQSGITSVPRYVFNGSNIVTGVQDSKVYLDTLEKEFAAWQTQNVKPRPEVTDARSCKIGEDCWTPDSDKPHQD